MESELINQGLTLMLAGMGTVFTFLTTLVLAMSVMSRLLISLQRSPADDEMIEEEVAAIAAAIAVHRNADKN